ncbi:RagB/SusD family nutrient uptake outer membrane protein [Sphingobacterium hotanense]|uniref:RagB/SusD family nutrient uptake outer membrane protein n=1 Tax=Sphingobacterium hotanense TaxID=649196 RepID=UPI0021A2E5FE|nr:RagB/SusD family nutrient uptake outer membrane protein [Sphingobacterium hotanense]MCT1525237.1 RagB/SusD family nutrient uptake outer membrane protein [Sphingobacterium hotanense]
MKLLISTKSIIRLALFTSTFFIASCNQFLELSPEDQLSGKTFFKTENDFRQALYAAYNPLRVVGPDFYTSEMRSDNTHYEYNPGNQGTVIYMRQDIADFTYNSSNDYSASIYTKSYQGISRANIVIGRLENADIADDVKKSIEGQARFLRAFYYFKLVQYFGRVPLYLTEVVNEPDAFKAQSSVDDVYSQIVVDAEKAIELLDVPKKFPQTGEATKGAASMLLAKVYATRKEYTKAISLLKSIETMGYDLLPKYEDVFKTSNKNSKESLFEVQFKEGLTDGMQSDFIYTFLPRCYNTAPITFGVASNNTSNTGGGWNTPTQEMIAAYEAGDSRLEASIGIAEGTYDASNYFKLEANKAVTGYKAPAGKVGVPYIKKYLNPHVNPNNTNDNWPVFRYADALLLMAEVYNEMGNAQAALPYLNKVRQRAMPSAPGIAITNQAQLKDIILHERRIELAFENHRWFDLLRSGKAVEIMKANAVWMKANYPYLSNTSYEINANKLLLPIPFSEIGVNPKLEQNPGY